MIKDKFIYGLITGILLPILTFSLLYFLNTLFIKDQSAVSFSFKISTVALFSICVNLIPTLIANKNRYEEFIRGIMFPTVLGAFIWFFYFDPMQLFVS